MELQLERSLHAVESVTKDEDMRKLQLQIILLGDENDELQCRLETEEERVDGLERALEGAQVRVDQLEVELQRVSQRHAHEVARIDSHQSRKKLTVL